MEIGFENGVNRLFASLVRAAPAIQGRKGDRLLRHPELTRRVLGVLGDPDRGQEIILVTGSKGKGSTSRLIAALLAGAGARVGLVTGPHLLDFRERIRLGDGAIPEEAFLRHLEPILDFVEREDRYLSPDVYFSPVGLTLALAMSWFREVRPDYVVVECGRGGRFDDANVLPHRFAVITPVLEEHLAELGPRLTDVAWHKAGILTPGTEVAVVAPQQVEALPPIRAQAKETAVRLLLGGEDWDAQVLEASWRHTRAHIRTPRREWGEVDIGLLGRFQAVNTAVALTVVEEVLGREPPNARATLARVRWPGRCQVLRRSPWVLVDGAINADSARSAAELLTMAPRPRLLITAVPADKDYEGLYRTMAPMAEGLWVTRAENPHLIFPEDGPAVASHYHPRVHAAPSLKEALAEALPQVGEGTVAIVGTQSLVADALRIFGEDLLDLSPRE